MFGMPRLRFEYFQVFSDCSDWFGGCLSGADLLGDHARHHTAGHLLHLRALRRALHVVQHLSEEARSA